MYGDITKLKYKSLPYVDLFVAGPPCQLFSTLNNDRLCSDDSRLDVLVSCLKYIKAKRPKFAIIENVVPIQKLLIIFMKSQSLMIHFRKYGIQK